MYSNRLRRNGRLNVPVLCILSYPPKVASIHSALKGDLRAIPIWRGTEGFNLVSTTLAMRGEGNWLEHQSCWILLLDLVGGSGTFFLDSFTDFDGSIDLELSDVEDGNGGKVGAVGRFWIRGEILELDGSLDIFLSPLQRTVGQGS